jgi:Tol biopolymer transport system component
MIRIPGSPAVAVAALLLTGCVAAPQGGSGSEPSLAQDLLPPDVLLGFQWEGGSGDAIFTTRVDGAERARLLDLDGSTLHPDWSPDGGRVAFRSTPPGGPDQIWIARADGTDPEVVEDCTASDCAGADYPAWSPDGTSLAYTVYRAPLADDLPPSGSVIRVADVDSGERRDVAASEPGEILDQVRWSPDGATFVVQIDHFEVDGSESAMYVAVLPTAGGAVTRLTAGDLFGGYPDWNPADGRIVFCTYDLTAFSTLPAGAVSNLWTIGADGSGLTAVTENAAGDPRVSQPTWTLDGEAVLVTIDDIGSRTAGIVDGEGGVAVAIGGAGATHVRQIPRR